MSDKFAESLIAFAKDIYDQTSLAKGPDSSLIVSPFSISVALSELYAGSDGETKRQLRQALFRHLQSIDDDDDRNLHGKYGQLIAAFNSADLPFQLHVANRLYPRLGLENGLESEFVSTLQKCYRSDVKPIDYGNAQAASQEINDWAKEKTNGKIDGVIDPSSLAPDTVLIIINAVYFKGQWAEPFETEMTRKDKFDVSSNQSKEVDMMGMMSEKFDYYEDDHLQLLGLPYKGNQLFMYVFLPKERCGLEKLEKSMSSSAILKAINDCQNIEVDTIFLPKFKLELSLSLNDPLQKLGMTDMYGESANLSKITRQSRLVVSDVIHKAFIEVNEVGTEAAAVTAIKIVPLCAVVKQKYITFHANHPFLFMIFDKPSKTMLFMGRYNGN